MMALEALRHARQVARSFADACDGMLSLLESLSPKPAIAAEVASQIEPAPKPRKAARKKSVSLPQEQASSIAVEIGEATGLQGMVLEIIRKQPLTSGEIFERVVKLRPGTTIGTVYDACHRVKKANLAETRVSESDGQRRWHLIGKAA